jgi:hypothetical protein
VESIENFDTEVRLGAQNPKLNCFAVVSAQDSSPLSVCPTATLHASQAVAVATTTAAAAAATAAHQAMNQ